MRKSRLLERALFFIGSLVALSLFSETGAVAASGSYYVNASSSSSNRSGNIYLIAGELFVATTSGRSGDPYLYLYNSSNSLVASNDDGAGDLNSRISYSVPTTGNYQLDNKCHSNTPTCSYTVSYSTSTPVSAPTNSSPPSISGTTTFGQVLSTSNGSWNNSPTSYAYQWSRSSTSGGTYTNISGATSSSYTLVSADVGQFLKVTVTASNSGGSNSATSSASSQIAKANQSPITAVTMSATSKTYPYSQTVTVSSVTGGSGSGATATCSYKPLQRGAVSITAILTPTSNLYGSSTVSSATYQVSRRG